MSYASEAIAAMDDGLRIAFSERATVGAVGECWPWLGSLDGDGYGRFQIRRQSRPINIYAHRAAYALHHGQIDPDLVIDHTCCNHRCVNPAHLEQVTGPENSRRGKARRTHCKRGHPFDSENTRVDPDGQRVCKACANWHSKRYAQRRSAAQRGIAS